MSKNVFELSFKARIAIQHQRLIAWMALPLIYLLTVGAMRFYLGYKIRDLKQIRKSFKKLLASQSCPIMICANHLTKIDSLIMMWALGSLFDYLVHFRHFAWNLPEKARYHHNLLMRVFCYLGCCIAVSRGGDRAEVQGSLDKITYLLNTGHITMVFPEGKRSVTGKIDTNDYSYGVGGILQRVPSAKVLCIYLRGKGQKLKSDFPAKGEAFYLAMEMIAPKTTLSGLRATRDLASQVINTLSKMEATYFDTRW